MRPAIETAEAGERALVVFLLVTDRIGRDCENEIVVYQYSRESTWRTAGGGIQSKQVK
jgi:hypothetical protein